MAWYSFFTNIFNSQKGNVNAIAIPQPEIQREAIQPMPIRGGNSNGFVIGSVAPTNLDGQLGLEGVFLQRPLRDCDYDNIYYLGRSNNDISFAKDNVVQLASSPLNFSFDSSVSPKQSSEMIERCRAKIETWFVGGSTTLINSLFRQTYLFGCVSGEAQPTDRLDGVGRIVLLSPKYLYFGWDRLKGDWHPYQSGTISNNFTNGGYYQKLNLLTYKYIAYEQWREDIPYSVPPIYSALKAACLEDKMLDNLDAVVTRQGLMGFLEVVVNAPQRAKQSDGKPETDAAYQSRIQTYLGTLENQVEKGLSNGYVISTKQIIDGKEVKPEFNMTASTSNPQGLVGLAELVITMKCAGLKQDGALLGKNFSTTETLISTLLRKFTHQLMNYQELVCAFLEHSFSLDLRLAGYKFKFIDVSMDAPTLMDTQMEFAGLNEKRNYYKGLLMDGIIDQTTYSQAMGYDKPALSSAPIPTIM